MKSFPEVVEIGSTHVARRLSRHASYDFFRNVLARGLRTNPQGEELVIDGHSQWWWRFSSNPHNLLLGLHSDGRVDGQVSFLKQQEETYGADFHTQIDVVIPQEVSLLNPHLVGMAVPAITEHCGPEFGPLVAKARPNSFFASVLRGAGFEYTTDRRESSTLTLVRPVK